MSFSSTQPSLRARVVTKFPAEVVAGDGVTITKSGREYTFAVNGPLAAALGGSGVAAQIHSLSKTISVNFAAAGDNAITIELPSGYTRYRILGLMINGASANISAATFGLFTASGGGGTAIIAAGEAITVATASENTANNLQVVAPATANTIAWNDTSIFFRVGSTAAGTGNVTISYQPLP